VNCCARFSFRRLPIVAGFVLGLTLPGWADGSALKQPLAGLIDMGDISFHRKGGPAHNEVTELNRYAGSFGGIAINVSWSQLEPTRGTLVTDEIDRCLGDIRAYNAANPQHPIGARLRVWPGPNAPDWAMHLGGDPLQIVHRGMTITVGRFWLPEYRAAWREMETMLAAKYDDEPLIREVAVESGSSITDEPFILPLDQVSARGLHAAGFTDAQYQACLQGAAADYAGWKKTLIEYPFNPYHTIDSGHPLPDLAFTLSVLDAFRHALGARAVLSNHGLSAPLLPQLVPVMEEMKKLGPPINLQMYAPKGIDLPKAIGLAISCGAGAVELWSPAKFGGFTTMTPGQVQALAALFPAK
jgi:hypothetical protein